MLRKETLNLIVEDEMNFRNLFSICIGRHQVQQRRFQKYLGEYNHWNYNFNNGKLYIDDREFDIECIGTTSRVDNYFFSSEIEKIIPDEGVQLMIKVRKVLENMKVPTFLTNARILLEGDINGYNLSAIYIAFCQENVAYFCGESEKSGTSAYLFVKNLPTDIFKKITVQEFFDTLKDILSNFNVNKLLMAKALLTEFGIPYVDENGKIIAVFQEEGLTVGCHEEDNKFSFYPL